MYNSLLGLKENKAYEEVSCSNRVVVVLFLYLKKDKKIQVSVVSRVAKKYTLLRIKVMYIYFKTWHTPFSKKEDLKSSNNEQKKCLDTYNRTLIIGTYH